MTKADKKLGIIKSKERELKKEIPTHGKKKKKKNKKSWEEHWYGCPFCHKVLEKIDATKERWYFVSETSYYGIMVDNILTECKNCGAFEVKNTCPACHRNTWFLPDDKTLTTGVYKHWRKGLGCGFEGRKIIK